jgi:hypothetical protein
MKLTGLISLYTNPVSILSVPESNRPLKPLTPLIGSWQDFFSGKKENRKIPSSI